MIENMRQDYEIAGLRIRFSGEKLITAIAKNRGFNQFTSNTNGNQIGEFILAEENDGPALQTVLYDVEVNDNHWQFGKYAGGYICCITNTQGMQLKLWSEQHTIFLAGALEPNLLHFICWIGYGILAANHQTVSIHTSAIVYREHAVLFLGESGTGKSTHTRLWRENIEGAFLLNDDSPMLRIINGKPFIFGSPWSGKTPCYLNAGYPVAACVRLSQAPYNKIELLPVLKAYAAIHPSCPPAFAYDDHLYDAISQILDALISQVPMYHMACLPNAEAAFMSCKTIFGA